ncbi:MAG TPA: 3-oxoacyl-[acyl-carrier-protein] synthase III C-terminal domain-containing protein [Ilumatobacteraceae bacterium]|nr:3-oxoacyl-[acyl-carrier-protein] synthase III C-terminal domain-containing protein [Ilumatobacteraceae bacterium]
MNAPVARLRGVATAVPRHVVTQARARELARQVFGERRRGVNRLLSVFDNSGVERRNFCVAPDWFSAPHTFGERNGRYIDEALALSVDAARAAMVDAGIDAEDIDAVCFVSSTGLATPSLDARLVLELGCPPSTRRDATFGHGCAGGVGGLARSAALARGRPGSNVLLVATELCSLTFRFDDVSTTNLVASSLFADGSAAVVVSTAGDGPAIVADSTTLWPDTADVMGFEFTEHGLGVVLDRSVPAVVRRHLGASVAEVCQRAEIAVEEIDHFLLHPGGAKVLDAYTDALPVERAGLERSWAVLADHGNMSAPTALFVLQRALRGRSSPPPEPGDVALVSAMGPGFAAEHVLLRW